MWLRPGEEARRSPGTHKLYVSPAFDSVRPALRALVRVVTESDAIGFKLGADLSFVVRPDKLVVYLSGYEETVRLGQLLDPHLAELRPHAVPFTCSIGDSGLLSWGMDPPDGASVQQSWRGWVTLRLAEAMSEAPPGERVGGALRRVEELGVDPVSWEPGEVAWERDGPD